MPTVFVSGGAGMLGSAVVEALLRRPEYGIRATYRSTPPSIVDNRVEHVCVDVSDPQAFTKALAGCDAAVLAASESGGIRMLSEEPWRQVGPNLIMAATSLEALHAAGIRRAVFVGSATVYQPCEGPIRERDLDFNADPAPEAFGVGWVMRAAEKLCEFWGRSAGLEIVRLRAANIYGPRARFDPARSNFIPALIRKVADRADPLEVWGSPDVTRDVIYSADVAEAIARVLDAPAAAGQVFNVGSGVGVRVADVVRTLLEVADCKAARVVYGAAGPGSSRARVLNCDRLRSELHWTPSTPLAEGLRETLRWWRTNRTTWQR
jgi:nucleoside-diphosphate-sugar epimerase